MSKVNWPEILAQEFRLSDPEQAVQLWPAAFKLLASPNPKKRDHIAYPALATWLEQGHLDDQLQQVGDQAAQLFTAPEVHTRSFAALILAEVVNRDATARIVPAVTLRSWQRAWAKWYAGEKDLRSFDPRLGWLHALAHGADVAACLARHPGLTREQVKRALDTLQKRLQRIQTLPAQYEDDRIAMAAYLLLLNPQISRIDQLRWLVNLRWLMQPGFETTRSAATAFTVQTARALLMFTHYGLQLPDGGRLPPSPELQAPLLKALKSAFHFAYPD